MREKGQTEVAKTLETPVFSRGIEILTEKTEFIYHPRARRTDAEPVMHKVNSLVIIGSFFQYMMRTCPD